MACQKSNSWLEIVDEALDMLQASGQTMTYLEFVEKINLPGPHRIHRLTELLEQSMVADAKHQRPPRACLVVSRVGDGLPGRGFFERARALGIMGGETEAQCHRRWQTALKAQQLIGEGGNDPVP